MLKYVSKNNLKITEKKLLFSGEQVLCLQQISANRTNKNISNIITKFHTYIGNENVYCFSLRFLVNLNLVNQSVKLDPKIISTLEGKMSKLFESNRQLMTFPTTPLDTKIIYYAASYIQLERISLNLYRQYLETVLLLKKVFRMDLQKSLLKKILRISCWCSILQY